MQFFSFTDCVNDCVYDFTYLNISLRKIGTSAKTCLIVIQKLDFNYHLTGIT